MPNDPKTAEAWIKTAGGISIEDEVQKLVAQTMKERGVTDGVVTYADVDEVAEKIAVAKQNGFKRDPVLGLYIEARQVKAGLKEVTNILYASGRWGPTKKGPKDFLAERVFVQPDKIYLGRAAADGIETMFGHVKTRQGPRSNINQVEYVERAAITFDLVVTQDAIEREWWESIWNQFELIGLGAIRSQGYGQFDLLAWDKVDLTSDSPEPLPLALA